MNRNRNKVAYDSKEIDRINALFKNEKKIFAKRTNDKAMQTSETPN